MQIISKVAEKKLIRRPLEFFRYERKNRGDVLGGCATPCQNGRIEWNRGMTVEGGGATPCQNGRSMIEMLGVLAIIGVLSVGGIMGYSKAMMRYKINKTIEQITYIAGNVRTTFASQGNYEGLITGTPEGRKLIEKAHIIPNNMWKDAGNPQSVWGDEFVVSSVRKGDHDSNGAFYMSVAFVPEEACIELLTYDWRDAQVKMFDATEWLHDSALLYVLPPVEIDKAVKVCSLACKYEYGILGFYFDVDTSANVWKNNITQTERDLSRM